MKKKRNRENTGDQIDSNDKQQPYKKDEYIKDTSPHIFQKTKLKNKVTLRERDDLTENQKKFLEIALDNNTKIMFVSGPAGTSKTFLSVFAALRLLNDKKISDLIYLRSVVESSEHSMGFLPGSESEKLSPYVQPLMDKLEEFLMKQDIQMLIKDNRVSGHPINFLRGVHWACRAIIADECQNMSYKELFTLITRVGEFSKVFIIGDPDQVDIKNSGFDKMMTQLNDEESVQQGIRTFKFTDEDVVRSALVKFLLKKLKK